MGSTPYQKSRFCFILFVSLTLAACSTGSSYFVVKYQLPPASTQLKGKTVYITFKDMRADKNFMSESAKKDFKGFSGLYSLYMVNTDQSEELVGGFKVDSLFTKAFQKRLETMGVNVLKLPDAKVPTMELGLKEFFIDYKNRKWFTTVSYQAQIKTDKGNVATEGVNSSGERIKMPGMGNVEKYLGEIFSESLNKLDVAKLFQQAGI